MKWHTVRSFFTTTLLRKPPTRWPLWQQAMLVFLVNLFLTMLFFRSIPAGQTYDEIIYLSEAKSIVAFGTDLTGTWRPWFLAPSDGWYSELTSTTWVPGFFLFRDDPLLAARFMSQVLGSSIPVLLGLIAVRVLRERRFFLVTAAVLTVNPWIFQFSRMSFDSLPSVTFYTLGVLLLLWCGGWRKLWALPVLFWGFFQYQGHKPLLVPLVVVAVAFLILEELSSKEVKVQTAAATAQQQLLKFCMRIVRVLKQQLPALVVLLGVTVLTVSYLVRMPYLSSSVRSENFEIFSEDAVARTVDETRRVAFDSPVMPLFVNKYTVKAAILLDGFFASMNPTLLFMHGDARVDLYALYTYGLLHWFDVVLILLFFTLVASKRRYWQGAAVIVGIVLVGSISNVLRSGELWITFRGAFTVLGLSLAAGLALAQLNVLLKKPWNWIVLLVYGGAVVPFLFQYFVQYPVQQTKYEGFYYRVIANYFERVAERQPFVVIPDRADAMLDYLVVYGNVLESMSQTSVYEAKNTTGAKYLSGGVIIPECPDDWSTVSSESVVAVDYRNEPCSVPAEIQDSLAGSKTVESLSLVDTGTRFRVYNDTLCSQFELPDYPRVTRNVLAVEQLSDAEFCQSFFVLR